MIQKAKNLLLKILLKNADLEKEFEEFLNYLKECVKYTPLMASSAELTRINEEFYRSKFRNNE